MFPDAVSAFIRACERELQRAYLPFTQKVSAEKIWIEMRNIEGDKPFEKSKGEEREKYDPNRALPLERLVASSFFSRNFKDLGHMRKYQPFCLVNLNSRKTKVYSKF